VAPEEGEAAGEMEAKALRLRAKEGEPTMTEGEAEPLLLPPCPGGEALPQRLAVVEAEDTLEKVGVA
jgi:hypothetical protein